MSDIRKWKALITNALKENDSEDMAHQDHEVSMAKSQMLSSMKSINRIAKHLATKSESEGLEGWTASKLTMAEDYLQVVADYFDGQEINEGYKVLPPMDKEKYQARDGLEGPFSTLSGKVVYYDPKEGKYYDPDTDMYMSYDEFRRYDDDYKGMKDERDEVNEAHQINWPYEDMEDHAYNAIRHGMHAYDAFDHVFSMAKDSYQRDWLKDNKDDIIKMFASYGLQTESLEESDNTKYGIIRYPDTAISYIKNDGNGWEHIFDKSYGFEGPVDKEDLKYAKKIDKEKIPSRMFESPFKGLGKTMMKRKLNKQYKKSDLANFDDAGIDTSGKTPDEIRQMKSDYYHDHMDKAERAKKAKERLSRKTTVKESEALTEEQFDEAAGEKDACYRKVKSRYKVWPSAYASGALVKCRKVGAKNWGNSKKD